tara:strand:- start:335 stop:508 length:174 start_codon:yes stop_codon:yes gene_type:complete
MERIQNVVYPLFIRVFTTAAEQGKYLRPAETQSMHDQYDKAGGSAYSVGSGELASVR